MGIRVFHELAATDESPWAYFKHATHWDVRDSGVLVVGWGEFTEFGSYFYADRIYAPGTWRYAEEYDSTEAGGECGE